MRATGGAPRSLILFVLAAALGATAALGARHDRAPGRFDHLEQLRSGGVIGIRPVARDAMAQDDPLRAAWDLAESTAGGGWRVWIDERSGLPALATTRGVSWTSTGQESADLDTFVARAEEFLAEHPILLGNWGDQVVLDRDASGRRGEHVWVVRFAQVVDGVRVDGARYEFHVSRGNLVAFGTRRWAPVGISAEPALDRNQARRILDDFVRASASDGIVDLDEAELRLIPVASDETVAAAWSGPRGAGIGHRLIWRFRFTDADDVATWTGEVDAHTGEVVAFYDDTDYDRVRGQANRISDDGQCDIGGCLDPDTPMPFVYTHEDGGPAVTSGPHGRYECTPGSTIETNLAGPYFRINDYCGAVSETVTCGEDLDLGAADDINCGVAPGASPGNTDAARSSYYALNLVNQKARFWMPGNTWVETSQVECRTNSGGTCNASWAGNTITMNRAGNGCGNTGQIQGIVVHEWGHGMDYNDGGGKDNSSEAYADVVAIFESRTSCMGRGFHIDGTCDGYGDTCLTCTGIRELDWDARATHTPATPSGYLTSFCGGGGGPCGKQVHCESHVPSEAMFDLATRDLPAIGLDAATAWQLAERLWYQSRPGSGGDIFNCTLPNSDSCGVGSWYHQLRLQDDDDGNLSNGTPHAAAIFAAFDRHDIACGAASDPENQNTSSCSAIDAPVAGFTAATNAVDVTWDAVPGASAYRVYRNENGCDRAQFPVAEVAAPATSHLDDGLANGVPVFYRVQAIGSNAACESPVSNCFEAAAQQTAGTVRFDRASYGCSHEIGIEVTDLNHPTASITVTVWSDTETAPETVVLSETSVGSARYAGSIFTTSAAAAADGMLSVTDGDLITTEYIDLDDGEGGVNVPRQATAGADCASPVHVDVRVQDVTDADAVIAWTTSEATRGEVEWGLTPVLGNTVSSFTPGTDHAVAIGPFTACDRVFFRVTSTDPAGNTTVADVQGAPFEFNAYTAQGVAYFDGFESNAGWTLDGEWEIAAPAGLGTAPGDPTAATEGGGVLGHDLGGQGSAPGDYPTNRFEIATSPSYDLSGLTSVELRFDRWLNCDGAGTSSLQAKDASGAWQQLFSVSGANQASWSEMVFDVSAQAAGNPDFQIRFQQNARFGAAAGWNVDRLTIRDGDAPEYGPCGGCTGDPTFAGATAAIDDSCVDAGLTVSWTPAPAWGSGGAGTYSVYRDTAPGFTPGPGNRVATGIAGTSWTDLGAPSGVPVYFLVRAENDETCGTGPNNGGLTDPNAAYVEGFDVVGQQPPGDVGNTVTVERPNGTDVRVAWTVVPDATTYNVYRSTLADTGFSVIGQPSGSSFDDTGAQSAPDSYFYLVTAVNDCGGESEN